MIITIIFSFIFSGFFVKRLSIFEIDEEEKKEKEMIQYINKLDFEYKYLDEIELLEDIVLEESYIKELENIKMEFEVPNNKLIIFYKDSTFMYYTEFGDIIYKYLNVACRKYVIDNNCLQIYNYDKVDNKDNKVDNKDNKVDNKDNKVDNKDNKVDNKDNKVDNKDNKVDNKDNKVDNKDNKVDNKDNKVDNKDNKVDNKDNKVENNLFVKKKIIKKESIEKKINKTRWLGTFCDMKNENKVNNLSFIDFLKLSTF